MRLMVNTKGQEIVIGSVRELPNKKWVWNSFGRAGRKQHESLALCMLAVHNALGTGVYVHADDLLAMKG